MKALAEHRKAIFDYVILERYEAGIELLGIEVKSVKAGRMNLAGSYAVFGKGGLALLNADIPPYQPNNTPEEYNPTRSRRLLLSHKELAHLKGRVKEKGLSLIPLRAYTSHNLIKIEIGLAKSKTHADKRETIKKRDAQREIREEK